jgi:hypothetical protein
LRLPDFSEESDDLDDLLPDSLLFEELLPLEAELPDLPDDEFPVLPADCEWEPDENDSGLWLWVLLLLSGSFNGYLLFMF